MSLTRVALALANLSAHHATLMQPAPKVEEHEMTKYDVRPLNPTGVSLAVGYVNVRPINSKSNMLLPLTA